MSARPDRPHPPVMCSAATMAYLFDVSETTWWKWVREGYVSPGVLIGGSRRWHWPDEVERIKTCGEGRADRPAEGDSIMEAIRGAQTG